MDCDQGNEHPQLAKPKHEFPTARLVEVDWNDSFGVHGWGNRDHRLADIGSENGVCKSVGYIVEDTDERLTLAESVTRGGLVGCTMSIPRFAIVCINTLREASP